MSMRFSNSAKGTGANQYLLATRSKYVRQGGVSLAHDARDRPNR